MEDQRNLSLRVYDVLAQVGASEKMRKFHKRSCTTKDILQTVGYTLIFGESVLCYTCGSTYEGSVTPDLSSDMDEIVYRTDPPVVLDPRESTHGQALLMVRDAWTYPGYVKLQAMFGGLPLTGNDIREDDKYYGIDEVGRMCRRHFTGENMKQNSPADKDVDENGVHVLDFVFALKCYTLPLFASTRLGQLRRRGVISNVEFDKLSRTGCLFVSTGYHMSQERELEWRLSLTLQERHLMLKLNPAQHKVYILLKMIKKNIIEKVDNSTAFTSYHCKTLLLYAVEITQEQSWTPDNIINCLMQCIKLLILWLKRNFCPNFFNTDQNLFSKAGFSTSRRLLLLTMEHLLRSNNSFLSLIQTDHVGQILLEGVCRLRNVLDINIAKHRSQRNACTIRSIVNLLTFILHRLCGGQYDTFSLVSVLDSLHHTETITEHTAAQTQSALGYLKPWLHLHLSKSLACLSYTCRDRRSRKHMMRVVDYHFRKAENTYLVNVRLAKATLLFKSEHHEVCFCLLQKIENSFTHRVLRLCPCAMLYSWVYLGEQDRREQERIWSSMTVRKILQCYIACCITFLPSQFQTVPIPLRYEMFRSCGTQPGSRDEYNDFWFDWCVVDAKVYLYLMQYLVSTKLQKEAHKQAAIDNIRAMIEEDNMVEDYKFRQLGHRETAYNILGWIYMQEQRYGDATHCFLKSWNIRPFHNAAKFHMRDLLIKMNLIAQ